MGQHNNSRAPGGAKPTMKGSAQVWWNSCNLKTQEAGAGGSEVKGSLDYIERLKDKLASIQALGG